MRAGAPDERVASHGLVCEAADFTAREPVAVVTQPDSIFMSRPTRHPNTQTPKERELWQRIRQDLAKATAQKREHYGLRSNREAHLFSAPPQARDNNSQLARR